MTKRFYQRLAVAFVSYVLVIPAVYFFIKRVYGLGDLFALVCVGIAVLLTLPVLVVRGVQRYREIDSERR
jgi:4-amino-4-deoxy-L-arabinose transferase-like glycosyltransferase